jgi:DNA-binding transcriptional ArsR family regulator
VKEVFPARTLNPEEDPLSNKKKRLAELSKGLAHPVRVEVVRMLENKPVGQRCVCGDIVDALPLAQSSVSQHLKILKETGWIQGEIDGPRVCYCTVDGVFEEYKKLLESTIHVVTGIIEQKEVKR